MEKTPCQVKVYKKLFPCQFEGTKNSAAKGLRTIYFNKFHLQINSINSTWPLAEMFDQFDFKKTGSTTAAVADTTQNIYVNNKNASVFIFRRLHPDDNERVITTL